MSAADEAARLAPETGQGHWAHAARLVEALVAAASGNAEAAAAMTQESEFRVPGNRRRPQPGAGAVRAGPGRVVNQRYAEGLAYLRRILDPADPAHNPYVGTWGSGTWSRPRPTPATLTPRGPTWTSWNRWRRGRSGLAAARGGGLRPAAGRRWR